MRRFGILLLLLAAGSLALGCDKSMTEVEGKSSAKMLLDGKGDVGLPEGFPSDVPVYPGSNVTMRAATAGGMQMVLKSADPSDKVAAFYKEKLKGAGWQLETSLSGEGSSMVTGKKDQRSVVAVIGRNSGGTAVTLMLQQPGK
jgi:hypothetical protein